MNNDFKPRRRGFRLLKIVAGTAVVLIAVAAVVLPKLARPRTSNCRISCVNNQKQLGIAFRGFGIDLGGFPMTVSAVTNAPGEISEGKVQLAGTALIPPQP